MSQETKAIEEEEVLERVMTMFCILGSAITFGIWQHDLMAGSFMLFFLCSFLWLSDCK
jgi:hypothetical protein